MKAAPEKFGSSFFSSYKKRIANVAIRFLVAISGLVDSLDLKPS